MRLRSSRAELELALAAIQYPAEGAAPEEVLRLADDLLFGERGTTRPRNR